MIQILILTGLMAIIQIEAVSVQAVHTYETILGVVLLVTDLVDTKLYNGAVSSKVQVIRDCLEVLKVVTGYNNMGFSTGVWTL